MNDMIDTVKDIEVKKAELTVTKDGQELSVSVKPEENKDEVPFQA